MIEKMLTLSTAHVSEDTAALLEDTLQQTLGTAPFICFQKDDYGWFVHVPADVSMRESLDTFPEDLRTCMDHARAEGCTWLMFDRDADLVEGLPAYDWEG